MTFFARVQDVFEITGRGVVLVLPKAWDRDIRIGVAEKIQLRIPDGRTLDTRIHGIELINTTAGCLAGILLPLEISRSEISSQTEIWLIDK